MRVATLRVVDVRNYGVAEFTPEPAVTLVHGPNGSGKSNLLEAIALFATLSSPRTGSLGVLTRRDREEAAARLETDEGSVLEIRLRGGRTTLRAGGAPAAARTFLGRFRAVLFTPEDLDLVRGEPDLRRRALDDLIVQLRPAFRGVKREYDRALRQRNAALRHGMRTEAASYDGPLAEAAGQVLDARRDLLAVLAPGACALYDDLAGRGDLALRYRDTSRDEGLRGDELVGHLRRRYADGLAVDLDAGTTRVGPHRDDLEIEVDGRAARTFASRGEQRSAALAMRLMQLRLLHGGVLLLDDVLSELDGDRRARLFKAIEAGTQVIVASADRDAVTEAVDVSAEWAVSAGSLRRVA